MCHYKNAIQCIAKSIERFQLSLFLFIYLFYDFLIQYVHVSTE
jgi:hypothetical protein